MISLEWVNDYIDISDQDLKELAVKITKAGINVEKVISSRIDNLVIGEVKECIDHPNSDHLHVCQVDIGSKVTQIVCGADNVKKGIKVVVSLPGCVLPGGVEIKCGKIRGEESNGMICALSELGLEEETPETRAKGIYILEDDAACAGDDANVYLGLNDTLYELDIHKHRNNDCYYHIGFAYEIACILNRKVKLPEAKYHEIKEDVNDYITLGVKTSKCPYYSGKMVKDVKIKESPEFIKKRLQAAGMRSINNVVDISNYVMLEYGQPLHFFDYQKLGNRVLVRDALDDEAIVTLDKVARNLSSNDIVIANSDKAVCIAGVMGGENTEVDNNTTDIFIEAAIFDAISIRNTSAKLNLRSEASIRYGKGLSYEYTNKALDRACYLLEKYADAKVLSNKVIHDVIDKSEKHVKFKTKEVNTLLGLSLMDADIETELKRLDFEFSKKGNTFDCIIPKRRLDIDPSVNDIAEEIGRLYGYHNLKSTLPVVNTKRGVYVGDVALRKSISKRLRSLGLNETRTYTLTSPKQAATFRYEDKKQITLLSPMSIDKSVIRTTILPSLMQVYEYNKARKVNDILIYEIAKTYDINYQEDIKVAMLLKGNYLISNWNHKTLGVDFYILKGILENLLDYLGFKNRYNLESCEIPDLHPKVGAKIFIDRDEIGIIGKVHPNNTKDDVYVCEISMSKLYEKKTKNLKYKAISKYPEIIKDVAFVVNKNMESNILLNQIKKSGGRLLSKAIIFDVYEMENAKSIAFKLTYQDDNRTLVEEEVMENFNKIITDVESILDAKLRN